MPRGATSAPEPGEPMYPAFIVELLSGDDSAERRRREEEWRAWHRRPDAPPLDPAPAVEVDVPGNRLHVGWFTSRIPRIFLVRRHG